MNMIHSGINACLVNGSDQSEFQSWRADMFAKIQTLSREGRQLQQGNPVYRTRVMGLCQRMHDCLSEVSGEHELVAAWQNTLWPFFSQSPFLHRARTKPRGYAGDYLTIQMMYDAIPQGPTEFARFIDAWALNQPCPRAVRNRRALVTDLVLDLNKRFPTENLSIVSLGSGPAAEVFQCLDIAPSHFHLIDIDSEALQYVARNAGQTNKLKRVSMIRGNIIKMLLARGGGLPSNQHAFYSLGLIDYLKDDLVVRLLDCIYDRLKEGGLVLLGNFRPNHSNADFFQHALDWQLKLRNEDQLLALVSRSKFRSGSIGSEAEGIQLFAQCEK